MDFTWTLFAFITALNCLYCNIFSANAQRFGRPKHCKKACVQDSDCTSANRNCLRDGDDCGKSCVNRYATCPSLKDPAHGWVLLLDTVFNSSAEYGCYKGYELIGKSQRRCRGDRQWSEQQPICRPIAKCDRLPEIFYGVHNGSNVEKLYDLNTVISYRCMKGYYPEEEHMSIPLAKCALDRSGRARWHGPKLVCRARTCSVAPQIPHSVREGENYEYPNEVTYTCDLGYRMFHKGRKLSGNKLTLRCLENGFWNTEFPYCYPVNCSYPHNPINGEVRGNSVSLTSEIHYTCKRGYRLVGQYSRKCKADGTWTGSEPICSEIVCPPLRQLYNGEIENNGNTAGTTVYFRCWEATSLIGLDTATCKITGEWSNTMPVCLAHCKVPYILNGKIKEYEVNKMVRNGTSAELGCSPGYEPEGDGHLVCSNGTWLQPTSCKPADCDWPPKIRNALAIFVKSKHGSYARYECNPGFRPANNNKMQCRYGTWGWARIGQKFHCLPVFCSNPRAIYGTLKGGQILLEGQVGSYTFPDYNDTEHGRSITFQCNKGYILIGPPRATCINGTWMPNYKPECIEKKYPTMEGQIRWSRDKRSFGCQPIRNDYRKTISYSMINQTFTAKVTCLDGYHFRNSFSVMYIACVNDRWERPFPKCVPIDKYRCRIPLKKHGFFILVENKKFLQSGELVKSGSKVRLICDFNSKVNGYDTVECRRGKFLKRAGKCRPRRHLTKPCLRPNIKRPFIAYRSAITLGIASKIFISSQQATFNNGTVIRYKCTPNDSPSTWDSIICSDGKWQFYDEPCVSYVPKIATSVQEQSCKHPAINPSQVILNIYDSSVPKNQRYPHGTLLKVACAYDMPDIGGRILKLRCRHGRWTAKRRLPCKFDNSKNHNTCDYQVDLSSRVRAYSPDMKRYITFQQKFPDNALLQFSCIDIGEKQLRGNDYTICRNKQWIFKIPKCVPLTIDDGPPPIRFHIQHGPYSISPRGELVVGIASTVYLYCLFGFGKKKPTWETTSEYRDYPQRISTLSDLHYGNCSALKLIINAALFQDQGKFQCILNNGQTNSIKILVKDKICEMPQSIPLLKAYPKQYHYFTGTTVQFLCPEKYQIDGERSSICIDGEWSNPPPTCQSLQCPPISLADDALSVVVTSYSFGGLAHFSCLPTHQLIGSEYIQCSTDGKWTDSVPKCKSILQCTFPGLSPHCKTATDPQPIYLQMDAIVYYSANPDYKLDSDGVLVCLETGEWSNPLPTCSAIQQL